MTMDKKTFLTKVSEVTNQSSNVKAIMKSAEDVARLVSDLHFQIERPPVETERHYFDILNKNGMLVGSIFATKDQFTMFIKTENFYFTTSTTKSERTSEYQNLHAITADTFDKYALAILDHKDQISKEDLEEIMFYDADKQFVASDTVYSREHFNESAQVTAVDVMGYRFYPQGKRVMPYEHHATSKKTTHGWYQVQTESIENGLQLYKNTNIYTTLEDALSKLPQIHFSINKEQDSDEINFFNMMAKTKPQHSEFC